MSETKKKINLPNKITIFRVFIILLIVILKLIPFDKGIFTNTIFENTIIGYVVLFLFVLGSYSDHLDGKIARKRNLITTFGKFMDPIADKLLIDVLIVILACYGQFNWGAFECGWIIPVIMISRDLVIDMIRLAAAEQGTVIAASKLGKLKTVTQMVALILIMFMPTFKYFNIAIYVAAIVSLISGIDYVVKNKQVILKDLWQ